MGKPAARVTDNVMHPLPGVLTPGPGSKNVIIGYLPAWRGLPGAAAAALKAAKQTADIAVKTAETATKAAAGTPGAPAALAAEQATKTATLTAMSSAIQGAAGAAGAASGGMVDIHSCLTPSPAPPHGPGVVIDGSKTVLINGLPACRMGDSVLEPLGPLDKIIKGEFTVHIGDAGGAGGAAGAGAAAGAAIAATVAAAVAAEVADAAANILSEQGAQTLFDEMAAQTDIPFDYTPDCCYARAHRMSSLMRDRGIESRKAWAYGSLSPVAADGSRVEFPPGRPVTWGYHVAPTIQVRGADGTVRDMVIDPSLRDRPLTVSEWEATMGGATSRAATDSDIYIHVPSRGLSNLSESDIAVGDTEAAFARHTAARDAASRP